MTAAVALALLAQAAAPPPPAGRPLAELLEGVRHVAAPGTPSPLAVWSADVEVVLVGSAGEGLRAPAVAAGRAGAGRFVALPHEGCFSAAALATGETGRFLVNATRWAAGPSRERPRVAARGEELARLLNESGCDARPLGAARLADELATVDVVCGLTAELALEEFAALERFLGGGGGVIAGQCARTWLEADRSRTLAGNPLNRFFARHGLAWTGGFLGKVGEIGFATERAPPKLAHGDDALTYLMGHLDPSKIPNERPMLQSVATMAALIPVLPPHDRLVRPRLEQWAAEHAAMLVPTPERPLRPLDGLRRSVLAFAIHDQANRQVAEVEALPCAKSFPGEVPAGAPRVTRSVSLDTAQPRWHATGLYAAPGEPVIVSFPSGSGAESARLVLQIGAHDAVLSDLEEWRRAPEVVRRAALDAERVVAASPFGGLLFVDVPEGCGLGTIELRFERVIEAPAFVLGRNRDDEWRGSLRHRSAPWAVLEGAKVRLVVPSSAILALAEPERLLRTWDRAADAVADLVALPRARRWPERIVVDVEVGEGHSRGGYPILARLDEAPLLVDPDRLVRDGCSLFHELGRNRRDDDWIFEGAGAVTPTLVRLHVLESVAAGRAPDGGGFRARLEEAAERVPAWRAAGASHAERVKDPLLAVQPFLQLQRAFGWEPFRKAFADFRGLPQREKPGDDATKSDLWLVTLSRACQKDLGPFFTAWGIPTSEAARAAVAALAPWMPEGLAPR